MATVSDINNQFCLVIGDKTEFYQYPKLSNLTYVLNNDGYYYIQFTYEDDYFVKIKLEDITNQPAWINTYVGAERALADISGWIRASMQSVIITSPIGDNISSNSVSVTIANDELGIQRTPTFVRRASVNGTVAAGAFAMSFSSVGTDDALVAGEVLKPGETINFDAGAINNTLAAVSYDTLTNPGAELIIITII